MTQEEIDAKVDVLRKQYPAMFDHPERKPTEIYCGDQLIDFVIVNVVIYRSKGLTSARYGGPVLKEVNGAQHEHRPVFVDAGEFFEVERTHTGKQ